MDHAPPTPPTPDFDATPEPTTRVLFVCGKNRWRSPTAEQVFAGNPEHPGLECLSAGLSNDAPTPVSVELVQWAEVIFVMEPVHKRKLAARFGEHLANARVVCLNIPDRYREMDPALIELLERRVPPHLC
ncbi:MAG: low molecular weight protein tyrosine phosphatase family protein [Phycisphaerales bacterium JB060]